MNGTNGDIRLVGGADQLGGQLEVCYDNLWGTVCIHSWGPYDANVACRQLGYANYGNIFLWGSYVRSINYIYMHG